MRYFKRHWNENRGDQYADWGNATYFSEVTDGGDPKRQMEVYANGKVLQYDHEHAADSFGMLADQALNMEEFADFEIAASEFEQAWGCQRPHNR
jgi:hypothetical protein